MPEDGEGGAPMVTEESVSDVKAGALEEVPDAPVSPDAPGSPEYDAEIDDGPDAPGSPEDGAVVGEDGAKTDAKREKPKRGPLKDKRMRSIIDEDLDWIWIGDAEDARNKEALQKNNVRYVLNCTPLRQDGGVLNFHEKDPFFSYCRVAMGDNATEKLSKRIEASWDFMERARIREDGGILVHCQQGVSRSVSMVIAYLMKYYRKTFDEAMALAKTARKQACPNEGFTNQLRELEDELRKTNGYGQVPPKRQKIAAPVGGPAGAGVMGANRGPARGPSGPAGPARGPAGPAGPARGPVGPAGPARGPVGPAGPARGPVGPAGPARGPSGPAVGPSMPQKGPAGPPVGPGMGPTKGPSVGPAGPPTGPSAEKRKAVGPAGPPVGPGAKKAR